MSVSLSVLNGYFPVVVTLEVYLRGLLQPTSEGDALVQCADPDDYLALLSSSYVATHAVETERRFDAVAPMSDMKEIIQLAQEKLFAKAKGQRPMNIITQGYRKQTVGDNVPASRVPLNNFYINTMVTALHAQEWELLLLHIGEDAMLHLLTETSIFISLPNGCLCQLTGEPMLYMRPRETSAKSHDVRDEAPRRGRKRKLLEGPSHGRPSKRLKQTPSATSSKSTGGGVRKMNAADSQRQTPADVTFVRARMFYARPYRIRLSEAIIIGLPPRHILNHFYPAYQHDSSKSWVDPDPQDQLQQSRHLARYVFPRQYGLNHPFLSTASRNGFAASPPDYLDREPEIKLKGPCKTPKRLKHVLGLLERMIWQHRKCRYKLLLDLASPSKLGTASGNSRPLDSSIILDMMSETTMQLQTQATFSDGNVSLDSSGRPIVSHIPSQAHRQVKQKPRFAEFVCSVNEVYRFAVLVTKSVIPNAFWGCEKNMNAILENMKRFIIARRYETTTIHQLLQGFSTSECEWLMPNSTGALSQTRVCVSDSLKRRELLEDFMFWYFDGFLMPLLKTTFYITESSAFRNRLLYFRQDDWDTLCAPLVDRLTSGTFRRLDEHEAQESLRQRKLGFSFVRLLPKETGVRPIVNLRRRAEKDPFKATQSINQILQATFQILSYEKRRQIERMGASTFGPNDIYSKLRTFKARLTGGDPSKPLPKLYFVKVDIQACFDSIEQTKLLELLRNILRQDAYIIQRYGIVKKMGEKVQRRFLKRALSEDEHPHFVEYAARVAEELRNTIFVDQVVYPFSRKEEIIALLEEHITENIVKIGNNYYRQMVGIPQGSVLSAILCSYFYGDLERDHLQFTHDPECLLLRLVDDWLFITTDAAKATKFYDTMAKGHPEYGCFISQDKSLANFDHPDLVNLVDPRSKGFPWCGYLIDMRDLSVTADYGRYHDKYVQDSLTVDSSRHMGATFIHKMMQLAKARAHVIYHDARLNSRDAIFKNVYQGFLLLAMKMHHYMRGMNARFADKQDFVTATIKRLVLFTYSVMRGKAVQEVAKTHDAKRSFRKRDVAWLGAHAFHTALSKKPRAYGRVLKRLEFELSLGRNRRLKALRHIVAEGPSTLALLNF